MLSICRAISCSHSKNIIHRDLKPGNVLISEESVIKVTDFGLAGMVGGKQEQAITKTNMVMGTLNYMAPEQRKDAKSVDHRADIYSLGVILYECLTGQLPIGSFDMPSYALQGAVTAAMDEVVLKALAFNPDNRYSSVDEFAADLQSLQGQLTTATPVRSLGDTIISASGGLPRESSGLRTVVRGAEDSSQMQAPLPPSGASHFWAKAMVFLVICAGGAYGLFSMNQRSVPQVPAISSKEQLTQQIRQAMAQARSIKMEAKPEWKKITLLLEPFIDEPGAHQTEAAYLVSKSLVEWSKVNDQSSSAVRDALHRAIVLLGRISGKETEYPDVPFYVGSAHFLLGEYGKARESYDRCINSGLEVNQSTLAVAVIKSIESGFEDAVNFLVASPVTGALSTEAPILLIADGYYRKVITSPQMGLPEEWLKLTALLQRITLVSAADKRFHYMEAVANCLSSPERNSIEGLTALYPELIKNDFSGDDNESQGNNPGGSLWGNVVRDQETYSPGELKIHCLFALGKAFENMAALQRKGSYFQKSVDVYEHVIGASLPSLKAFERSLINQSRYSLASLYIIRLRKRYKDAVHLLRAIDSVSARSFPEYDLYLGIGIFRSVCPPEILIPDEKPSAETIAILDEGIKRLSPYERSDTITLKLASMRTQALVYQFIWDFDKAEELWQSILKAVNDLDGEKNRYGDEALLSLARLSFEIPGHIDDVKAASLFSKVTDNAGSGPHETLYWYVHTMALGLPNILNCKSEAIDTLKDSLNNLDSSTIGGIDFFRGISALASDSQDQADEFFRKVVPLSNRWSDLSLIHLSRIELARATSSVVSDEKFAHLEKSEGYIQTLLQRNHDTYGNCIEEILGKVKVMRAALKDVKDMTVADLEGALKLENTEARRIPLVLALSGKYIEAGRTDDSKTLLDTEITAFPKNRILVKTRAFRRSNSIVDVAGDTGNVAWEEALKDLLYALTLSVGAGEPVVAIEKEFLRLLEFTYSDVALQWLDRFSDIYPASEKVLTAMDARSDEIVEYGILIKARKAALKANPDSASYKIGLAMAYLEKGKNDLSQGLLNEGRKAFDEGLKCAGTVRRTTQSSYEKAWSWLFEGKVYRQLMIHNLSSDATRQAVSAYRKAHELLKELSGYRANTMIVTLATDLSEIYLRSQSPLDQQKYLQVLVSALEEMFKGSEDLSVESFAGEGRISERDLISNRSCYEQAITNLAWNVYRTQGFDPAVKIVTSAVRKLPEGNVTLAVLLGCFQMKVRPFPETSLSSEELSELVSVLNAASLLDPTGKRLRSLLASALIRKGEYEDGLLELSNIEKLVAQSTGNSTPEAELGETDVDFSSEAALLKAEALLGLQRFKEVEEVLSQVVFSDQASKWIGVRLLALSANSLWGPQSKEFTVKIEEASKVFEEIESPSLTVRCQFGDLLLMSGDIPRVRAIFSDGEESAEGRYRLALAAFLEKDYVSAEELFSEIAGEASLVDTKQVLASGLPSKPIITRFAALSALGTGHDGRASQYFDQVLGSFKDDPWSSYYQARIHYRGNRLTMAAPYADVLFDVLSENYSAVFLSALIAFERGSYEDCELRCARAVRLDPHRAEAHFLSALVCLRGKCNREKCSQCLEKAIEADPLWNAPLEEMGILYIVDRPESALQWFDKAEAVSKELSPRAYLGKGIALRNLNRNHEALEVLYPALSDKRIRPFVAREISEILSDFKEPELSQKWSQLSLSQDEVNSLTATPRSSEPAQGSSEPAQGSSDSIPPLSDSKSEAFD